MRNLEQAGSGEFLQRAESLPQPISAFEVQSALMWCSYHQQHPSSELTLTVFKNNALLSDADRSQNMVDEENVMQEEWIAKFGENLSLSEQYRKYVEGHSQELIDPTSEEELAELLSKIITPEVPTIH